jgi:hypothetical protein
MVENIKGIEVDYDLIDDQHQSSYWYGGDCAEFTYKGCTIDICANGDVIASLIDKDGEEVAYCKDKGNNGSFYWEMSPYIKNDEELYQAIKDGNLIIEDNNWWEVFVTKNNNCYVDLCLLLDSEYLMEAIEEAVEEIINYVGNK